MDVSIVIVNFNSANYLIECIKSVKQQTSVSYEIIVVDNASTDDSVEVIRKNCKGITLIENKVNSGFASANNQGFDQARGRYLFMLNPDTIVLEKAIDQLVHYMDMNRDVGISAPKNVNIDGRNQANCDYFPSILNDILEYLNLNRRFPNIGFFSRGRLLNWGYHEFREVEKVMGCSLMIRIELYKAVGGLDNRFFLYFEETDLCYRVRKTKHKIMYHPVARIIHFGGESTKTEKKKKLVAKTNMKYFFDSKYYFYKKNYGYGLAILSRTIDIIYAYLVVIRNTFRKKCVEKEMHLKKGKVYLSCLLPRKSSLSLTK